MRVILFHFRFVYLLTRSRYLYEIQDGSFATAGLRIAATCYFKEIETPRVVLSGLFVMSALLLPAASHAVRSGFQIVPKYLNYKP